MHTRLSILSVSILMLSLFSCKADKPIPAGTQIDSIVVIKNQRQMQVYSKQVLVKTYIISLGAQPVGHKEFKGDMRTPEGIYYISGRNPNSICYKNLGISYPNSADRKHADSLGKNPGGDIKIHGLPNGQGYVGAAHRLKDWTYGCIAVTNEEMEELYNCVNTGAVINILP